MVRANMKRHLLEVVFVEYFNCVCRNMVGGTIAHPLHSAEAERFQRHQSEVHLRHHKQQVR